MQLGFRRLNPLFLKQKHYYMPFATIPGDTGSPGPPHYSLFVSLLLQQWPASKPSKKLLFLTAVQAQFLQEERGQSIRPGKLSRLDRYIFLGQESSSKAASNKFASGGEVMRLDVYNTGHRTTPSRSAMLPLSPHRPRPPCSPSLATETSCETLGFKHQRR